MSSALSLLPIALTPVFYALLIKLAARLYRGSLLSWKHAFAFGALAMLVGSIGTLLHFTSGFILGPLLGTALGLSIQLALGGWYLGPRALASTGGAVAFKGGTIIAAIGVGIALTLSVLLAVLMSLLGSGSQA